MSLSSAYHKTGGKAIIEDEQTGTRIDHVEGSKSWVDPSQPLRERIAARIANHVKAVPAPTCVDVGCAVGKDCATLLSALGPDRKRAKVYGVDVCVTP